MSFRNIFIAFSLVGLLALAMINFAVDISSDNNSSTSILDDPSMSVMNQSLSDDLSTFESKVQAQRLEFEKETPSAGFGTLIIFAIIGAGKIFTGMIIGIANTLFLSFSSVRLGIPAVFLGVMMSILIITLIMKAWRVYKQGE